MPVDAARLGVAVVGLGVGEVHARTYAALDSCDLRWVYDLDPSRGAAVAAALGCGPAGSFEQVIGDPLVGLVSIASYDDAHYRQVMAALEAGKHVFVEKPICRALAEQRVLKSLWRRSGRHLGSNLILRAAPLYRWLKDAMATGEFGEVYAIDGDYLYGRLHKITDEWRKDVADYSVMQGGGVHLVDLLLWLTGQRPGRISAAGTNIATRGTAFRYRDFLAATLEFPSGLVGRVTANFGSVHRHQHVVRVFGTRATFIQDDLGARVYQSRDPSAPFQRVELAALAASKGDLIPGFVKAIVAGGAAPDAGLDFDVLAVCAAADRAADTGSVTEVTYD
jgi:predicted dehydrogenase